MIAMRIAIPEHGSSLGPDMEVAMLAAAKAGAKIIAGFGRMQEIREKGVGDLVSAVDEECDAEVHAVLKEARPDDDILSEELASRTQDRGQRLWVVDPLDATAGFLFMVGDRIVSTMVALREELATQLAVVFFPLSKEWFYAKRGEGCFKDGERVTTAGAETQLRHAWVDMNHFGNFANQSAAFTRLDERLRSDRGARLVTRMVPHSGIATELIEQRMRLAAVVHDNDAQHVKQAPWDIAPPQLLLEEAGGVMINQRKERIDPFKPELIIAAANVQIAEAIVDLAA